MRNQLRLLPLVVLLLLTTAAWAGPQFEIVNPTMVFGKVSQNKTLTTDFWIKSIGDEELKINVLWGGCGCTDIPLSDSTLDPGDSLQCRVTFSTGRFQGLTTKRPAVGTNASESITRLSIVADVVVDVESQWPAVLRPELLDVSQFGEKTRRIGKFHLENRSDEDLKVFVSDSAMKSFEVRIDDKVKAGETIEGRIRVRDEALESNFNESVTLRLEGKEEYWYTLPIERKYYNIP